MSEAIEKMREHFDGKQVPKGVKCIAEEREKVNALIDAVEAENARLKEQNEELRELVELMWQTHCGKSTAYGWIHVMEEAERLGITLEYPK